MLLREQLEQALDRIANDLRPGSDPAIVQLSVEACQVTCEVTAVGTLGCAIQNLSVVHDSPPVKTVEQLQEISERLAHKLTYLLEPVATIEVDTDEQLVQMRSDPPHRDEQQRTYYELHVCQPGRLELCRYQKSNGQARHQVPAQFTREVLARLIGDCVVAVSAS